MSALFRRLFCLGDGSEAVVGASTDRSEDLFSLPCEVLGKTVFTFLRLKDIAHLDTAIMNRQQRHLFHESFVCAGHKRPLGVEQFMWIATRNFCPAVLSITRNCSLTQIQQNTDLITDINTMKICQSATVSENFLTEVLKCCPKLWTLAICECIVDWPLVQVPAELPLIQIDVTDNHTLTDETMMLLITHSPHLEILNMKRTRLTSATLWSAAHHSTNLYELTALFDIVSARRDLRVDYDAALREVLAQCVHLTTLSAFVFTSGALFLPRAPADSATDNAAIGRPQYDLAYVALHGHVSEPPDGVLLRLVQCCPYIECLELTSLGATDVSMHAIANHAAHLHTLRLDNLSDVTDDGVSAVRAACTRLTTLQVDICRGLQLYDYLTAGPAGQLQNLTLRGLRMLDDQLIINCARHNSNLHTLYLWWHRPAQPLTATCLSAAVAYLPHLISFSVCAISSEAGLCVNDGLVQALIQHCANLTTLAIGDNKQISKAGFTLIANLHNLRSLYLSWCPQLCNAAVCAIAKGCVELRMFYFNRCTRVSSSGVYALAQHCRKLQRVDMMHCTWVRDYAVLALLHNAPDLQQVRAYQNELLSAAVLQRLEKLNDMYNSVYNEMNLDCFL